MGRKKKKKYSDERIGFWGAMRQETFEGISAIVFILIAIFLLLSPISKAGFLGDKVYAGLSWLFGIGYFLIPIILITLGISFIKSLSHNLAWPKITGGLLMMVAGLGLIDLLVSKGGVVGAIINKQLLGLFGTWMVAYGHIAVLLIAI